MQVYNPTYEADFGRSILWQNDKAVRLNSIITNQQQFFDDNVKAFWDDYRNNIFNLETADEFGLAIWGLILGIERPDYFDGVDYITFSDETYRLLLKARMMATNMTGSMPDINDYLAYLFPDIPVFAYDNLNMTISYYFATTLSAELSALIAIDGVLPRPAGVEAIALTSTPQDIFGFAGQQLGQFDNSVFAEEPEVTDGRVMWTDGTFLTFNDKYLVWE